MQLHTILQSISASVCLTAVLLSGDNFVVGIAFAMVSGLVVGNGVIRGGVNNLVGVAISASLLPPVVNAGMCISFALVGPAFYPTFEDATSQRFLLEASWAGDSDYIIDPSSLVKTGLISFALYCMNVTVIVLVVLIVFATSGVRHPDPFTRTKQDGLSPQGDAKATDAQAQAKPMTSATAATRTFPSAKLQFNPGPDSTYAWRDDGGHVWLPRAPSC